ncbi:MAG: hypothetical protein LQ342_005370 [Letrouitia transgressa]|nr:MAG: hypothetical protein LQ342_005370 [Letrouitia transgressa]
MTLVLWITLSSPTPTRKIISKDDFAERRYLEYFNPDSLNTTLTSEPITSFLPSTEVSVITIRIPDSPFTLNIFLSRLTAFTSLFAPLFSAVDAEISRQVHEHGDIALVPSTFRVRGPVHVPFFLELAVTAMPGFRLQWNGMEAIMRGLRILIEVRQRGLNKLFGFVIIQGTREIARGQVERFRAPVAAETR